MYYAEGPGLYTDVINPFPFGDVTWPKLVGWGFEWATFQVYNPHLYAGVKDFDLAAVKAHGLKNVGVWGVIYDLTDFYTGGKALGTQAVKLGAQNCIVNAEMCMKNTRATRAALPIIRGIRDGGWAGPVDLITLGAPWNPDVNDYAMDLESFLDTGGSIHSEDYLNESEGYGVKEANVYYDRLGIPKEKVNHSIALYSGAKGRIDGAVWVPILKNAGVTRNFSTYMIQDGNAADYEALSQLIKSVPVSALDAAATREAMISPAEAWLTSEANLGHPQTKSRIRLAKRILKATDLQLQSARDPIYNALNGAGVAQ